MNTQVSMVVPRGFGRPIAQRTAPSGASVLVFALGLGIVAGCLGGTAAAAAAGIGSLWIAAVVTATIVPLGALLAGHAWMRRIVEVIVHENGIVLRDRHARVAKSWGEVARVYEKALLEKRFFDEDIEEVFVFECRDGRVLVLDARFPDHVTLGRLASNLAQDALLAEYEIAAASGTRLSFGAISLDDWGIHTEQAAFPWTSVGFVRWESVFFRTSVAIHLKTGGAPVRVPSDDIANERVVLSLIERRGLLAEGSSLKETAQVAA